MPIIFKVQHRQSISNMQRKKSYVMEDFNQNILHCSEPSTVSELVSFFQFFFYTHPHKTTLDDQLKSNVINGIIHSCICDHLPTFRYPTPQKIQTSQYWTFNTSQFRRKRETATQREVWTVINAVMTWTNKAESE